jgi:hypothetical protein
MGDGNLSDDGDIQEKISLAKQEVKNLKEKVKLIRQSLEDTSRRDKTHIPLSCF